MNRSDMLNIPDMNDLGGEFLEGSLNFNTGDYSQLDSIQQTPGPSERQFSSGMTPQHSGLTPHHMSEQR